MANKSLFASSASGLVPVATAINEAGGKAYQLSDKAALAQLVVTGTFGNTYYVKAEDQLNQILTLANKVSDLFLAQLAVYARQNGYMKDTPALLCAILAARNVSLLKAIFNDVIDNGKMLRNFVQMIRSSKVGRKSFGSAVKKIVQKWITSRTDVQLFKESIGNDPSMADCIKLVHPCPKNKGQEFMFGYLCDKISFSLTERGKLKAVKKYGEKEEKIDIDVVPDLVKSYEEFKLRRLAGLDTEEIPAVPFQMLSSLNMGQKEWSKMAETGGWTFLRMNLNNLQKYEVFDDSKMVDLVAKRIADKNEIAKAKAFPYQLLTAFKSTENIPNKIKNALQDAMEIATDNIPSFEGKKVYVCVDTSGSMASPATGNRGTATSTTSCIDVAALMASCILRKNEDAEVIPFDTQVHIISLNSRDSIMTNAQKLARNGGGTDCSCSIKYLNAKKAKGDLIILISDNESWADKMYGRGTGTMNEFEIFRKRNPGARLINIDITPNTTAQVADKEYVLNIGGFSDSVFDIVASYATGKMKSEFFIGEIEKIKIDPVDNPVVEVIRKVKSRKNK